ncbi:MAG: AAA family ATPase, partial [Thermoplasmata archaeon]
MKILIVTGMPGSGKGEFVNIAKKYNIPVVSMGDTVREYTVNVYKLEPNSKNVGLVAREERIRYGAKLSGIKIPLEEFDEENRKKLEMDGFDIWAIRMIPKIEEIIKE